MGTKTKVVYKSFTYSSEHSTQFSIHKYQHDCSCAVKIFLLNPCFFSIRSIQLLFFAVWNKLSGEALKALYFKKPQRKSRRNLNQEISEVNFLQKVDLVLRKLIKNHGQVPHHGSITNNEIDFDGFDLEKNTVMKSIVSSFRRFSFSKALTFLSKKKGLNMFPFPHNLKISLLVHTLINYGCVLRHLKQTGYVTHYKLWQESLCCTDTETNDKNRKTSHNCHLLDYGVLIILFWVQLNSLFITRQHEGDNILNPFLLALTFPWFSSNAWRTVSMFSCVFLVIVLPDLLSYFLTFFWIVVLFAGKRSGSKVMNLM